MQLTQFSINVSAYSAAAEIANSYFSRETESYSITHIKACKPICFHERYDLLISSKTVQLKHTNS